MNSGDAFRVDQQSMGQGKTGQQSRALGSGGKGDGRSGRLTGKLHAQEYGQVFGRGHGSPAACLDDRRMSGGVCLHGLIATTIRSTLPGETYVKI